MSVTQNSLLLAGDDGYRISRSVRLRSSASATFTRTPSVDGNRKKWTWSAWVKRGSLGSSGYLMSCTSQSGNDGIAALYFSSDQLHTYYDTNTTNPAGAVGPAVYRDPSAWYHIVWVVDAANTIHYVYVNNVLVSTDTSKYPPNYDYAMNRAGYVQNIGTQAWGPTNYFDGYLTEVNFIDGQALTPSSFGETDAVTGVWKPKKYTGTYGTNGFYLNFSDNSAATAAAIGKDSSGNGNNWTPNNISVTAGATYDSMLDVPTQWADGGNGRGNYATWNPIDHPTTFIAPTNGNLSQNCNTAAWTLCVPTFAIPDGSGLWQWELVQTGTANGANAVGVCLTTVQASVTGAPSSRAGCSGVDNVGTTFINGATSGSITYPTVGNTITCLYDATNRTLQVFDNGTSKGTITGLPAGDARPFVAASSSNGSPTFVANFGQTSFAYNKGGKALNTLNLPAPTILKGNQYFDALTWTGDGTANRNITGLNFQPDLVWEKARANVASVARDNQLIDAVRGAGNTLSSNRTDAEDTSQGYGNDGTVSAFLSNGFTVDLGGANVNFSSTPYVAWNWKEGATQGFDIVTYTEAAGANTIPHNLGVTPKMFITKRRDGAENWIVWFTGFASTEALYLNSTAAKGASGSAWISLNSSNVVVTSGQWTGTGSKVAYLFAEVAGFSKFGSYTGNASADGPFVFCGFRPKYILIKSTATVNSWHIADTSRSQYNQAVETVWANESSVESTSSTQAIDILSNGFKIRNSTSEMNNSGTSMIFAAFAENPFKNALAR